ncbi:MAG: substrate-binding periplasmic protein [Bacillota bacterium]
MRLKMKSLAMLIIVVMVCTLAAQLSYAAEQKKFTVGVQNYEEYLPYSEYKNGEYKGFNRELLDMFAEAKGYEFEYRALPIKRLYHGFIAGNLDFKYPDNPYWSSDLKEGKDITYSDPVVEYIDGVLVLPKNQGKGVSDLDKLGIISGFTPFTYLEQIESGEIKTYENESYQGLLKQVLYGRVDGAYSNIAVSRYYLDKYMDGKDNLVFDSSLPYTKGYRHLASIKHSGVIKEFNQFLENNQDKVKKLKEKYQVEDGIKNVD